MPTVLPTVTRDHFDAFVLDLDGTLLDGRGALSDRGRDAVRRLRDAGYVVVLATGRSPSGTRGVHEALGLTTHLCCYNGAWIGSRDGTDRWHYAPIPDDLVPRVAEVEGRARFGFRHQGERKYTGCARTPEHRRVAAWYTNVVEVAPGAGDLPASDLVRVSLFFDGAPETDAAWDALPRDARETLHREVFPLSIFPDFGDVGLHLCEIQRRGLGKAESFRYLEEEHGIDARRIVAVGDHQNDLPMLRRAGLAVAMGNAGPAVRESAHLVIGDHREDGFAHWVETAVA